MSLENGNSSFAGFRSVAFHISYEAVFIHPLKRKQSNLIITPFVYSTSPVVHACSNVENENTLVGQLDLHALSSLETAIFGVQNCLKRLRTWFSYFLFVDVNDGQCFFVSVTDNHIHPRR